MEPLVYVIDKKYLPALDKYTCRGEDLSLTRKFILNPIYELMIKFVPKWVAPNVITLIGMCLIMTSAAVNLYFSPDFSNQNVPNWVFLLNALCLLGYQTLDNLDGKQARNTQNSSGLGEMFDHGCDALAATFGTFSWIVCCGQGPTLASFYIFLIPLLPFIFATFEEYFVGALNLGYFNGPIEGILGTVAAHLGAWYFGQQIYQKTLGELFGVQNEFLKNVPLFAAMMSWAIVLGFFNVGVNLKNIFANLHKRPREGVLGFILALLPLIILVGGSYAWVIYSNILVKHNVMFWVAFGFSFAYFNSNVTLAFILDAPLNYFYLLILPWSAAIGNAVVGVIMQGKPYLDETIVVYVLLAASAATYANFAISVTYQMSHHLNIKVLSINEPRKSK